MKIGLWPIAVLIFGLFMITNGSFISNLNSIYDTNVNDSFTNTYTKITEMGNLTQRITDDVVGAEIDDAEPSQSLSTNMLSAMRLVLEIPSIMQSFFHDLIYDNGLPISPEVQIILLTIIIAIIAFSIIATIFGWKVI